MYDFSGKVAIVTGSGRGIGKGIAVRLAQEKAIVIINAKKRIDELNETLREIKNFSESTGVLADVATREGCRELSKNALEKYGNIDILINNAGLGLYSQFMNADDKLIDKQLEVSLKSIIYCTQEVGKVMNKNGNIVNISSIAGMIPAPGLSIYGMAKSAIISLTKTLAVELAPIKVNAIAPGVVKTKMGESLVQIFSENEEKFEKERTLLNRIVLPEDVAELAISLIKIPTITGQTIVIDSGQSLLGLL